MSGLEIPQGRNEKYVRQGQGQPVKKSQHVAQPTLFSQDVFVFLMLIMVWMTLLSFLYLVCVVKCYLSFTLTAHSFLFTY